MDERFTLLENGNVLVLENNFMAYNKLNPSPRSVSFIRQFARTYHVEPRLPKSINAVILN
jgi:hypothetical protein